MATADVCNRINRMLQADMDEQRARNYHTAYQQASGRDGGPPIPVVPHSTEEYGVRTGHGTGHVWCWTAKADAGGLYWSFRAVKYGIMLAEKFDNWKSHKQRNAARSWAKACAKVERARESA